MFIEVFAVDAITKAPMTEVEISRRIWDWNTRGFIYKKTATLSNATITINDSNGNEVFKSEQVVGQNGTFAFTYKIPADFNGGEYVIRSQRTNSDPICMVDNDFPAVRRFKVDRYQQMQ